MTELAAFDAAAPADAVTAVEACCASTAWQQALVHGRPYRTQHAVAERSDEVIALLSWPEVEVALASHPRIGDRAEGDDPEAAWSRREQAGAAAAPAEVAADLRNGNVAYEEQFGHVYLICATGRSAEDMLADLTTRLGNDVRTEREVVRRELAAIVRLRLSRAFRT